MAVNHLEVYLVNLDPTLGAEIKKTRPCKGQDYPSRVAYRFRSRPDYDRRALPGSAASSFGDRDACPQPTLRE